MPGDGGVTKSNIVAMPGYRGPEPDPRESLIGLLESLLEQAKEGRLQSLVGVGITADQAIKTIYCPNEQIYTELGGLQVLIQRYLREEFE